MEKPKRRILYSNYYYDDDYQIAYEYLLERHREEFPDDLEWEPNDNELWEELYFMQERDWDDFKVNFEDFFNSNSFILQGTVGRWNGRLECNYVFESLDDMSRAWEDCDYFEIFDENGHLYIRCEHHDGSNFFEIRMLNDKGYDYYARHKWYDDDYELRNKLMKNPYSVLPHCAHKIFGCKKTEYDCI